MLAFAFRQIIISGESSEIGGRIEVSWKGI